jgi:ubiquinone/menaquinone biosynthesis C-methylase UbiE
MRYCNKEKGHPMKLNNLEFFLMNNPIRAYIQEHYELPILRNMMSSEKFESVLEIGCGRGNGTKIIKKYFRPSHITAIDLDDKMIQIAKNDNNDENISFRVMDASRLDFPDKEFDAVFDFGIIHHIPNWKECLAELKRVLRSDGELILEEPSLNTFKGFPGIIWKSLLSHPYKQMFTTDEFVQHLHDIGFSINHFKELNPSKMLKHFSLTAKLK